MTRRVTQPTSPSLTQRLVTRQTIRPATTPPITRHSPADPRHFKHSNRVAAAGLAAVLLAGAGQPAAAAGAACRAETITLAGDGAAVTYTIEIADEPAEHAEGLMFRTEMAADRGMLFLFERPRIARFWMRNTFIPLDMIFIDSAGRVINVEADTVPFSEQPRSSTAPVIAVLEVNAGEAAEHGIGPGTAVTHPFFTAACQ